MLRHFSPLVTFERIICFSVLTRNRSILGDMFITPSISTSDYVAVALGLKFAAHIFHLITTFAY